MRCTVLCHKGLTNLKALMISAYVSSHSVGTIQYIDTITSGKYPQNSDTMFQHLKLACISAVTKLVHITAWQQKQTQFQFILTHLSESINQQLID